MKKYLNYSGAEVRPEKEYLSVGSGFRELLISDMTLMERELEEWRVADYPGNPFHQENLQIHSADGIVVRSKSEPLIASELAANGIPYRYECALEIEGQVFYPDFTIRHPSSGRILIWEHFGMIDQEEYLESTLKNSEYIFAMGLFPESTLL